MRNILSQTCVGSKEHFSSEYFGAEKKIRWSSGNAETSVETPEMYGLTQLGQHSKDKDERGERVWCTQHTRQRDNNIQTLVQAVYVFFLSFLSYISGLNMVFTLTTTTFRVLSLFFNLSIDIDKATLSIDGLNHNITLFLIKNYKNFGQMLRSLIWQNSYFTPLTKQFVRSQTWRGTWWNFKPNGTCIS